MHANTPPVFRFAPSPNGLLHLGHAYSGLLNFRMARALGGRFLLRVEDIDTTRCTPELEEMMLEDLRWLGLEWDGEPRRQSEHFEDYGDALHTLRDAGLIYPSFMTRGAVKHFIENAPDWPRDPDGSPHYPGDERDWPLDRQTAEMKANERYIWRLDMAAALKHIGGNLVWDETGKGPNGEGGTLEKSEEILANPSAWGDVVLGRVDIPTSYHLAVVLDDAMQGATHVVRGRDLFYATAVHRVLQTLLGLPVPLYHHHDLILGEDGRKLSKSAGDTSIRALRETGATPEDVARMVGL